MRKIAVILSGCGFMDGSEIRESVISLLAIEENGAQYECFAIDKEQIDVVDHLNQEEGGKRNILVESARIARGKIKALADLDANKFDVLHIPGGFGVAKNLSNFLDNGENYTVNKQIAQIIKLFYQAKKPICALCISPILLAGTLKGIKLTIGDNENIIKIINDRGNIHQTAAKGDVVIDAENKIITTPCYMYDDIDLPTVHRAVDKAVKASLTLIN